MSKNEKYEKKPRPADARRMLPEDPARVPTGKKKPSDAQPRLHENRRKRPWFINYSHQAHQERCFMRPVLHPKFDAYYCPKCLIWLEDKCDKTKDCKICAGRSSVKKALDGQS